MEALTIIPSIAPAFAAFVVVSILGLALISMFGTSREKLQQRLVAYGEAAETVTPTTAKPDSVLKRRDYSNIPVLQRLLSATRFADDVAVNLAGAGVPLRVGEYLLLRWVSALGAYAIGTTLGLPWLFALPLAFVGFDAPTFYVNHRKQLRIRRFDDQLVDAITMMANALKAGSSFLQAMDLVSRELPRPLAEEFAQVVGEVNVGATLDDALERLCKRIKSYDLNLLVTAILIQRQTGGNPCEVLENIAYTIRERGRLLRQVQVLTAQQRLAAIVVGLLPLGLVVLLQLMSPSYYQPFLSATIGRILLGTAFCLELVGFVTLNRLAKLDV